MKGGARGLLRHWRLSARTVLVQALDFVFQRGDTPVA